MVAGGENLMPQSFANSLMSGYGTRRELEAQKQRNALAERDMAAAEQRNALATRELDMRQSAQQRAFQTQDRDSQMQALEQLGSVARKALTLDPVSRRAFAKQAMQVYGDAFKALGADPAAAANFDNVPDQELEQALQQFAQFAPQTGDPRLALDTAKMGEQRRQFDARLGLDRDRLALDRQRASQERPKPTAGQDATDREFGKEYAAYSASGGFADTQKQLLQLREVGASLTAGRTPETVGQETQNLTGPIIGRAPDFALSLFNPGALAARDQVEEVVQRNLRTVLGAQFTEREGERLIARAYNSKLSEEENAKRVARLIKQIETAAQQKADAMAYFEQNGTLRGWQGKLPSMADFNPDKPAPDEAAIGGAVVDWNSL